MARLNLASALVLVAAVAGCDNTVDVGRGKGTLFTETDEGRVYDAGAFPVGGPTVVYVSLAATGADVEIQGVAITDVNSQKAFFELEEWQAIYGGLPEELTIDNGEEILGPKKVVVDTEVVAYEWPFIYYSEVEAWSQAEIEFTHNGRYASSVQKIRAQAAVSTYAIYPTTIDFGWVPANGTGTAFVTIENRGDLDLVVAIGDKPDTVFAVGVPEELHIAPRASYEYELQYRPTNDNPFQDTLSFTNGIEDGSAGIATINLRANDCLNGLPSAYNKDGDNFSACAGDCDDTRAEVYPGAPELPDGLDNDCDDDVDDGTPGYDDDGDGYCDHPTSCLGDLLEPGDCNDFDPEVNPGAAEINCPDDGNPLCSDGIDNDCDGTTDGGTADKDGDGYTVEAGDCDDGDSTVGPNRNELPDGKDNDCDATPDEGTVLYDDDGDGYCEGITPLPPGVRPNTCSNLSGTTRGFGDCNDAPELLGAFMFPGGPESTDDPSEATGYFGLDNNCNGKVDELTFWSDDDLDGYTELAGDCDDSSDLVGPHVFEIGGNAKDDDCNPATPVSGPQ